MTTDDIAVLRPRYRADDRPALARACRTPFDRERQFCAGLRMRREPDVIGAIGTIHRMNPKRRKTRRNDGPFHRELKKVVRFNARNQEL
jgi:hypothetical protein